MRPLVPERGLIYIVYGRWAAHQAQASLESLVRHGQWPVLIVGDKEGRALAKGRPDTEYLPLAGVQPFRDDATFLAGLVKPRLPELCTWPKAVYVDADTTWVGSPAPLFELLDTWELLLTDTLNRTLRDNVLGEEIAEYTRQALYGARHLVYPNSGVLAWRKTPRVLAAMQRWQAEWELHRTWDEQLALWRAVLRAEVDYLLLPNIWNTCQKAQAVMLWHRYGTGAARQRTALQARDGRVRRRRR